MPQSPAAACGRVAATASTVAAATRTATTPFMPCRVVGLPAPDAVAADLGRRDAAEELQRVQDLRVEELEHVAGALLAVRGEPPQDSAPGQGGPCAERQRLDDIRAAPDAAVH